jgi:putative redox protein
VQTYTVQVRRQDVRHVTATAGAFALALGAHRGDAEAGFNPVETLLAALGSCLLTALQLVADLSAVPLTDASVELTAVRQDKPPRLVSVTYRLTARTPVPPDRLTRLVETALRNSTVFQTLTLAIPVSGTVTRTDPEPST